jgi:hypothetical protein
VTDPAERLGSAPNAPIFIHAWFRSGSTWFWAKLRQDSAIRAYYEPLNEELAVWTPEAIRRGPTKAFEGDNHPPLDKHYFHEYLDLIEQRRLNFETSLSYERYFLAPEEADPALELYLANLVSSAQENGQRPALCFCRSQMRALWMRRRFGGTHLCQIRGPLDQWLSFGRHDYFKQRTLLTGFLLNKRHPGCLETLDGFSELYRAWQTGRSFQYRDQSCLEIFCVLWIASALQALAASGIILDIDRLGVDAGLRAATEEDLRQAGLPHDLRDCRPPATTDRPERREAVEGALARAAALISTTSHRPLLPPAEADAGLSAKLAQLSPGNRAILAAALPKGRETAGLV